MTEGKYHVDQDPDIRAAVELLQDNLDFWMSGLGPQEVQELENLEGARKWHGDYRKMYFKFIPSLPSQLSNPLLSFAFLSIFKSIFLFFTVNITIHMSLLSSNPYLSN